MMRVIKRPILAGLMALVLALTGHSMASARAASGPAGQIILCTGTGPITVLTDADGQPMAHPHICPDCAMTVFAGLADVPALPRPPEGSAQIEPLRARSAVHARAAPLPHARGPPLRG